MASRTRTAPTRVSRFAAVLATAMIVSLFGSTAAPLSAVAQTDEYGYPTWAEVENARQSQSAKESQIAKIKGLISDLEDRVVQAQALAQQRIDEAHETEQQFLEAMARAESLDQQAQDAAETAEESRLAASAFAGAIARSGGSGNMSIELFSNPGDADDMLYRLGLMDSVTARTATMYDRAQRDANSAQALKEQAEVARDERDALNQEAQAAMDAAVAAQLAAENAVQEQMDHQGVLQAQLAVLVDDRAATEADYQAGQEYRAELERKRLEEERRKREEAERRAREEAERREREEAERNPPPSSGGGGGGGGGGSTAPAPTQPPVNGSWARPSTGWISSNYGWRNDPFTGIGKLHAGTDFVAGCWSPVYAAGSGTVALRGYDLYDANILYINHGNGIQTRYVHMAQPAHVAPGQRVQAGQQIAYEGTTGWSTGCHLHFEVWVNGSPVNPLGFLSARGIR